MAGAHLAFWKGEEYKKQLRDATRTKLIQAAGLVQSRASASMKGTGSPHTPSAPGTPPARDTGALARSVTSGVREQGAVIVAYVSAGGGDVAYAAAQEFGYAPNNLPERPYLRPALESSRDDIIRILRS